MKKLETGFKLAILFTASAHQMALAIIKSIDCKRMKLCAAGLVLDYLHP